MLMVAGPGGRQPVDANPDSGDPIGQARRALGEEVAVESVESSLGVHDVGVFSDLDPQIQISLPPEASSERARAFLDANRGLLTLYLDAWPTKVYPLGGESRLRAGNVTLKLRPGDRRELGGILRTATYGTVPTVGDADADGIPDPLDILIGAKKMVVNAAAYGAGYTRLAYPGGDVARDRGVCTDVVVRAVRNAGVDIQSELQRDIRRSPRSYPMVKRPNRHIDHRRVKTLLPYFRRRWQPRIADYRDPADPYRPGDIIFMDTFPNRRGPDHIGIVSDRRTTEGRPLIINNWTYGSVTAEMDLLAWVPVTHRFRLPSKRARTQRDPR